MIWLGSFLKISLKLTASSMLRANNTSAPSSANKLRNLTSKLGSQGQRLKLSI